MIDYVPTEIVVYADDIQLYADYPTFDEAYPYILDYYYNISSPDGVSRTFDMYPTGTKLKSGGQIATTDPDLIGTEIYGFLIYVYEDKFFTTKQANVNIGVCYYVLRQSGGLDQGKYLRLSLSDVQISDPSNPFQGGSFVVKGEDVNWLYNLGSVLVSKTADIYDLLNFEVLGYNLISIMFGVGFIVYAGIVIKKFST